MIAYIAIFTSFVLVFFDLYEMKAADDQAKYEKHRFKAFRLREQLIRLYLNDEVSWETCQRLYEGLNWAIKYLREIPTSVIDGFIKSAKEVGISEETLIFQEELSSASKPLLEWYGEYTLLVLEAITLFTPVNMRGRRLSKIPILGSLYTIYVVCWLAAKLKAYRGHPLSKNIKTVFSQKPSLSNVRNVREKGQRLKDIAEAAQRTISDVTRRQAPGLAT